MPPPSKRVDERDKVIKYALHAHYVPDTMLGVRDAEQNKMQYPGLATKELWMGVEGEIGEGDFIY